METGFETFHKSETQFGETFPLLRLVVCKRDNIFAWMLSCKQTVKVLWHLSPKISPLTWRPEVFHHFSALSNRRFPQVCRFILSRARRQRRFLSPFFQLSMAGAGCTALWVCVLFSLIWGQLQEQRDLQLLLGQEASLVVDPAALSPRQQVQEPCRTKQFLWSLLV